METRRELDVLIFPDKVRILTPEEVTQWELATASQVPMPSVRLFVALYPYNPAAMSPNYEMAAEELPFVPGQLIKVFGDIDSDGFYRGESGGLSGYVPSNMVAEVPVDDEYLKHLLMQQGFLPMDHSGMCFNPDMSEVATISDDVVVRRMVALFDYDPWESSPNLDSEDELGFRSGDIINVLGDMDQDGFYPGDLHGRRGLVPSNYLQPLPWN
ncbi:RIMS-binding protein 2 isoform X2 [Trematomus bernacchii]|uniref:RIMS-binding protein 2 isoform X2 n=1 Tax=Trematomus bernacchii TaxID=40690 RepID=UPI00146B608B|nr:RIMS-binding protein 2 isoform X2 [Trematomus bernacchii]